LPLEPNALPDTRKYKTKAAGSNEHDVREILDRVDPAIREQARSIIRSFLKDVHALQSVSFLIGLDKIGSEPDAIAGKSEAWNALFSELWLFARRRFERTKMMFAEDLLHASAAIRVELEKRLQGFRTITLMRENQAVRSLGQTIANSLDIGVLFTTIVRHFPLMGIRTFFLLLYDGSSKTDANLRLKLACFNGKPMAAAALRRLSGPLMFKMHGEVTVGHPPVLIIEPLYFQKERFGMLVFEADAGGGELFDIVTGYISGALHSTFLVQKVKHQSTILGKANKELARLQVKEHAFLEAINRELDRGRRIQKGFLPQTLPQPKGWEIAASFVPARAVSGDFYDAFMLGEKHLAFAIADVSGKDVSAALFMALICTLIRILTERLFAEGVDPLNAVGIINEYVLAHYSQAKDRQMYTTLFLGLIEVDGGELHYCNAGHYPPVVVSAGSIQTHLLTTGPALGLIPGVEYKKETSVILPQTLLFAYTDGVTDARSPDGDQFTTARMFEIVKREAASASEKLTHIETALSEHTRGAEPSDDITILILRRL
jgi:serine phosphatase RsbU (regulator of sigma subunit)